MENHPLSTICQRCGFRLEHVPTISTTNEEAERPKVIVGQAGRANEVYYDKSHAQEKQPRSSQINRIAFYILSSALAMVAILLLVKGIAWFATFPDLAKIVASFVLLVLLIVIIIIATILHMGRAILKFFKGE